MNRREFNGMLGALAAAPLVRPDAALGAGGPEVSPLSPRRWSFAADVAECCSCDIPCPCNFGRPVETCHGTRLIQITQGDFEGADLTGINFAVTFYMGEWTRIYIDDSLNDDQLATLDRFLPVGFAGFDGLARITRRVPLAVEGTAGSFRFSVPESTVEMALLPGMDGGPIRVDGLPSSAFYQYVQYESVVHAHSGPDAEWSYTGTNGFRSVMRASG